MTKQTLNAYLAHAGVASRRKAVTLIKAGSVTVNGIIMKQPGYRVSDGDVIACNGEQVASEEKIYLLFNKPNDVITTASDEKGRRTVVDFFRDVPQRIYPVGRLDRQTTGLIVMTNDGDVAQKISHPKFEVEKVYHIYLSQPLKEKHLFAIRNGIDLEDGMIKVDLIRYISPKDHTAIEVRIHSGRNKLVRRIFEHFEYRVKQLDRVSYAGLTKKGVTVGRWRELTAAEIRRLKGLV